MTGKTNQTLDMPESVSIASIASNDHNCCVCYAVIIINVNHLVIFIWLHTDRLIKIVDFLHNSILLANGIVACNNNRMCTKCATKCAQSSKRSQNIVRFGASVSLDFMLQQISRLNWIVGQLKWTLAFCWILLSFLVVTNLISVCHPFRMHSGIGSRALWPCADNLFSWLTWIQFGVFVCHFSSCIIIDD